MSAAQPAHPIPISGIVSTYDQQDSFLLRETYRLSLSDASGENRRYVLAPAEFHPSRPDLGFLIDSNVTVWIDEGTSNLLALRSQDKLYSMIYFDHPATKYWDAFTLGLLLGSPGFLTLAGLAVWAYRRTRPARTLTDPSTSPKPPRPMFEWPYPTSPIPLRRDAAAIVTDFKQAVGTADEVTARPESALRDKREEIIEALFQPIVRKAGVVSADELAELKRSITALQTFVPDADAAAISSYNGARRAGATHSIPEANRDRAHQAMSRIDAAKGAVANFRYDEPEHLVKGANFMIMETLKMANPAAADQALDEGSGQAYGCIVYAAFGLTAFVQLLIGAVRLGSMQFWAALFGTLIAIGLAITWAKQINRLGDWADDRGGIVARVVPTLMLIGLVVLPVAMCLGLVKVLDLLSTA